MKTALYSKKMQKDTCARTLRWVLNQTKKMNNAAACKGKTKRTTELWTQKER
jgi:hypothetical protein